MASFTALYDACVLYPAPLRDLLMHLAMTDLFRARWTDQIHDEWIRNVLAKARIINEKKQKEENLAELERHRSGWFEPAIRFVNELKSAEIAASSHDPAEKLKFAKSTGSNFRLVNRELVPLPRDTWQLVVDQGSFAQNNAASSCDDAAFLGETHHDSRMRRR